MNNKILRKQTLQINKMYGISYTVLFLVCWILACVIPFNFFPPAQKYIAKQSVCIVFAVVNYIILGILLYKTFKYLLRVEILQTIFDASIYSAVIFDAKGKVLNCSPSFLSFFGIDQREASQLTLYKFSTLFHEKNAYQIFSSLVPQPIVFETTVQIQKEEIIDVEVMAKLIVMDGMECIYISIQDIRLKKAMRKDLQNEKNIAQNYLDIVNVMILVLDTQRKIKLLNRKGCEIIGYSCEEVVGQDWVENFLPKEIREEVRSFQDRLIHGKKEAFYYEKPVLTKSGEERLIAWHNTPLFDAGGEFLGILCSGEDITKMYQTQLELQAGKDFYHTMFASIRDAIIVLQNNLVIDCNDAASTMFGLTYKEFIGMNILETAYDIECKNYEFQYYLDKAYRGKYNQLAECSFRLFSTPNDVKIIEFTLSKFGEPNENKLIMVARDITKQIEEEKMLKMYSKQAQMGEVISMIAHQWRQPLAIINAIVAQMRLKALIQGQKDSEYLENLINIETQSTYLSQTISDYRNFFHPNKPKEYFAASSLIKNIFKLMEHTLKSDFILFQSKIKCDKMLYTYRNELIQVLLVLMKNSCDHFEINKTKEPRITIIVDCSSMHLFIRVYDNAGGISKQVIEKIFTPYFTTKGKKQGTGLGLYMSQLIVEDHCNGSIEVESHQEETVFTITLPYVGEVADAS
jgi:PAS domain S-box-containing protein